MNRSQRHLCALFAGLLAVLGAGGCALLPSPSTLGSPAAASGSATPSAEILVTTETLDRSTTLVGLLDFHAPADTEDKGFAALRDKAAELGADAVMNAEFEHGEDGGPSHLSGMAVKYTPPDERPFDVLGEIVIETPASAEDKGLARMLAKAARMGADEVREIRYEHGEDGEPSRLTGTAVLHRDR